jgi:CheY-like chemotaxis protein
MTQPLALLLYEKLLPGSQLVNRLQDIGWRVQVIHDGSALERTAEEHKPVLVFADLHAAQHPVCNAIHHLRKSPATAHIPVIAFSSDDSMSKTAVDAGANLVVSDTAVLQHLEQFIDQALSDF